MKAQLASSLLIGAVAVTCLFVNGVAVLSAQPHTSVLPNDIALKLLGSYELERPTSTGARDIYFTLVDDQPKLRIGDDENRFVFEGIAMETVDGVSSDVYKFTVVGKPGVSVKFKVSGGKFKYLVYAEDFARPPLIIVGKSKRR